MSALVSAAGDIFTGDAQAKAYEYNAGVERQQAGVNLDQSYLKAAQIERSGAREQGAMKAAYGAAGVTSEGTPLAVMLDHATRGEMNRRLTLYQGRLDALGHMQQSDADIASGKSARTGSYFKATGTILTAAENIGETGGYAGMKV